jgi:CHAT domain-containing protein
LPSFFSAPARRAWGRIFPGEGIYGAADSFLAGGAASVISTLWRVESDSSALFARRYYEFLVQTRDAASALAMTEREFIQGKWYTEKGGTPVTFDAPVYWAGFNRLSSDLPAR